MVLKNTTWSVALLHRHNAMEKTLVAIQLVQSGQYISIASQKHVVRQKVRIKN